ncbi:hypothetical protein BZG36_04592 [Bifiguratus adelaidae]|uniref:Protein-serine/threonine kinase n=1 Tax=Bifiguratus adelaidae TaxID=1938954 RepID=A0A261XVE8_9FUNG|nr:hypothetical protein BZG36_04592 [Bifiguratus adelaidae]
MSASGWQTVGRLAKGKKEKPGDKAEEQHARGSSAWRGSTAKQTGRGGFGGSSRHAAKDGKSTTHPRRPSHPAKQAHPGNKFSERVHTSDDNDSEASESSDEEEEETLPPYHTTCFVPCPFQSCSAENIYTDTTSLVTHLESEHHLKFKDIHHMYMTLDAYLHRWAKIEEHQSINDLVPAMEGLTVIDPDVVPLDKEIRETLQKQKLNEILKCQEHERQHEGQQARKCLFCKIVLDDRTQLFRHMFGEHNFNIGLPDNLVNVNEFLDILEGKLTNLKCLYCEKTFTTPAVLRKHMRKKKHFKIAAKNRTYDRFYVINYLEPGKNWETLENDRYESDDDGKEDLWADWDEEESEPTMCLFDEIVLPSPEATLKHLEDEHGFNLNDIKKRLGLDFYKTIIFINYIRYSTSLNRCYACGATFEEIEELTQHMQQKGCFTAVPSLDADFWRDAKFLLPTYENDPLLTTLDDEEDDEVDDPSAIEERKKKALAEVVQRQAAQHRDAHLIELHATLTMFRLTPKLYEKIKYFAEFPQTGVSLHQMVMFGQTPTQGTLFKASQFLHACTLPSLQPLLTFNVTEELPVRLAHRVKELEELPHNLNNMPSVIKVKEWYAQSFQDLVELPPPEISSKVREQLKAAAHRKNGATVQLPSNTPNLANTRNYKNGSSKHTSVPLSHRYYSAIDEFDWPPEIIKYNVTLVKTIEAIKHRHDPVVTTMGILEFKEHRSSNVVDTDIQAFLDRFYMSRIGIRMLIGQHVALNRGPPRADYVGIICTRTNLEEIAREAIDNARFICEDAYGLFKAPEVQLYCDKSIEFMYVPSHLSHMLFELLKNSLRAVVEVYGDSAEDYPPIKLIVAEGKEDITIKISDEGGGIPRSGIPLVWTYMYTTAEAQKLDPDFSASDFKAPMAGFGYGLPISRLYARYFGGDLKLISMEGYGTDVYLHLNRLSNSDEPLIYKFLRTLVYLLCVAVTLYGLSNLLIAVPVLLLRGLFSVIAQTSPWDDTQAQKSLRVFLKGVQSLISHVPLAGLMCMRYVYPKPLDDLFVNSLQFADTQRQHASNELSYAARLQRTRYKVDAWANFQGFLRRTYKRVRLGLAVLALSKLPYVGSYVIPLASSYAVYKSLGPYLAVAIGAFSLVVPETYISQLMAALLGMRALTRELLDPYFVRMGMSSKQKAQWFRAREDTLFGFSAALYFFVRIPVVGVFCYAVAQAAAAHLLIAISEPPLPDGKGSMPEYAVQNVRIVSNMSSIGTGYDLSVSTYSPDGRVFQVEYAGKAVDNSGTAIGLRVKDGVVLAVEKLVQSKLLVPGSNRRIQAVDLHCGIASAGLLADSRHITNRARDEAQSWRDIYRTPIPAKSLAERMGQYVSAYTLYSSVRPFGSSTILGLMDIDGPKLYMIEPSGVYWGYHGCAIGKGKQVAKTEIEKLKLSEMTAKQAVVEAARIIHAAHDDSKDKDFELEISWISEDTKGRHQFVPKEIVEEAERLAKESLNDEMDVPAKHLDCTLEGVYAEYRNNHPAPVKEDEKPVKLSKQQKRELAKQAKKAKAEKKTAKSAKGKSEVNGAEDEPAPAPVNGKRKAKDEDSSSSESSSESESDKENELPAAKNTPVTTIQGNTVTTVVESIPASSTEKESSSDDNVVVEESTTVETKKVKEKKVKKANEPFKRVRPEEVTFHDYRLRDNTYAAKGGADENSYGYKANQDLIITRGKGFRAEKNKKKRGSYRGGQITFESHSIKFE